MKPFRIKIFEITTVFYCIVSIIFHLYIIDSKYSDVSKISSNPGKSIHIDEIPPPVILVLNSRGEAAAEERLVGEEGKEVGEEMREELDVKADENIQTETVEEGWHAR